MHRNFVYGRDHICSCYWKIELISMQVFWTYVLAKKSIMNICMLYLNTKTYKPFAWSRKKEHMYLCMYTHHICSYIDLHSKVVACDRCDVRTSVWLSRIISTRALASSSTAQRRRWMNVCVCMCVFTRVVRIERGDRDSLSENRNTRTTCPCTEAKYIWSKLQITWTNNFAS